MKGTTLRKLHYVSAGASPGGYLGALATGGRAKSVVLAACVVLVARLVVGPFSQRATKVMANQTERNIEMNVRLAGLIHDGWFGSYESFSSRGTRASQEMFSQSNMTTLDRNGYFCPTNGTCTGTVTGAGFHFGCKSNTTSLNLLDRESENKTLFSIDFEMVVVSGQAPILRINTKHISSIDENCVGNLTSQECDLLTGTVSYPITIESNMIRARIDNYLDRPKVLSNTTTPGDILPEALSDRQKLMGALYGVYSGTKIFKSKSLIRRNADGSIRHFPSSEDGNNMYWPNIYIDTSDAIPNFNPNSTYRGQAKAKCPVIFQSPMRPMLRYIFDFTFRSAHAIAAAQDNDAHLQQFTARYKGSELFYTTDFAWLAITISCMILGIIATGTLLWGYWDLRHYVTLSPIETGKALGARVLQGAVPEQEADRIVKRIGDQRVMYSGHELMVWNGREYVSGIDGEKYMAGDVEMQRNLRWRGEGGFAEPERERERERERENGYRSVKLEEDGVDERSSRGGGVGR